MLLSNAAARINNPADRRVANEKDQAGFGNALDQGPIVMGFSG